MVIRCRQCQAAIPAENINRIHSLARCSACQTIFPMPLQTIEDETGAERPLVPMPRGFTVDQFGDELNISKCGLTHSYIPFIIFCLAVGVFTIASIQTDALCCLNRVQIITKHLADFAADIQADRATQIGQITGIGQNDPTTKPGLYRDGTSLSTKQGGRTVAWPTLNSRVR